MIQVIVDMNRRKFWAYSGTEENSQIYEGVPYESYDPGEKVIHFRTSAKFLIHIKWDVLEELWEPE